MATAVRSGDNPSVAISPSRTGFAAVIWRSGEIAVVGSAAMIGDAERDLLFALLALQNGQVDQDQLVAACRDWTGDRTRPLAEHFVARGDLDANQRRDVERLVGLQLEKRGSDGRKSMDTIPGEPSTLRRLTALGDPDVERTLSQLDAVTVADAGDDHTASQAVGTATSAGQRFHILRPHAQGGLGAVFVALDAELHREVALKQILEKHADNPISRARFVLEAEITGGLEHPGIVPVYGLGTYADGRPYYAMRFIRGDSLKEAADRFHDDAALTNDPGRRSLELRQLLKRFTDVCNAVDYAHSRGVLHRDIKPGNIILGKYGETLVVDWGVAKATGRAEPGAGSGEVMLVPSSASGTAETLPGSALGTPAYMSPEQAAGDLEHLGPQSDVYSLGATLYYLLTGRPPFEGKIHEVIRAVRGGEFRLPRQLAPAIDGALEAVCLKAMAQQPADRYASPLELAEDVERWMADEPVSAWREPPSRRARRWARRNRTAVTAATVALFAGIVGLAGVLVVQTQAKAAIASALSREKRANEELVRSKAAVQERYELAVEAIKTFHTGVSEDFLLKEEKFHELRDRLLRSASDFYGKLGRLLGRETDAASRRALAAANFELADLTAQVGRNADALAAHRAVLAARRELAAEQGASAAAVADLGRSLTEVARLLQTAGQTDEALARYREAEALLAGPATESLEARSALAACRMWMGVLLFAIGKNDAALEAYRRARADQEAPAAAAGASVDARRDLARTIGRIAVLLHQTGHPTEAEADYRAVLAIYEKLARDDPASTYIRSSLATNHTNLGILLGDIGRLEQSEAEYRKALGIYQELADNNSAVTLFRSRLAWNHYTLGWLLSRTARPAEAESEYRAAIATHQTLANENPDVTEFRNDLADAHNSLGWLLGQTGRPAAGEVECRAALAIRRKLAEDHPDVTDYLSSLAEVHDNLGSVLNATGRPAEAESEFRAALAIHQKLAGDNPAITQFRKRLADSHNGLGWLLSQTGRPARAETEYRAALSIFRKLAEENPTHPNYRDQGANIANNLAVVVRRLGRPAESLALCEQAVAMREVLSREHPETPDYAAGLAENLFNRGMARLALNDTAGATTDLRRSAAAYGALRSFSGEHWFVFACARAALAGSAGRSGSGVSAAEAASEADAAMSLLHKAVAMGYRTADAYRTEDALDPIRPRDDFRLLMEDLEFPADPFAAGR